jgi:Fe-S oxidoreductase
MKHLEKIRLNESQLELLLNDEEKRTYRVIMETNVFCMNCEDICPKGVDIESVWLNSFNNIHTDGRCRFCGNGVTRIIEFGENESFYSKALEFRKSLTK